MLLHAMRRILHQTMRRRQTGMVDSTLSMRYLVGVLVMLDTNNTHEFTPVGFIRLARMERHPNGGFLFWRLVWRMV